MDKNSKKNVDRLCILVLAVLLALIAISDQSLWIDEALTAWKAKQPTLSSWWQAMAGEKTSDLQMPLYMIYVWAYEKIFGSSEWVLRAANLPWFAIGMVAFVMALSSSNARRYAVALLVVCSPFAWYYLNEARPYAMQLGSSFLIFAALHRLGQEQRPGDSAERCWVTAFLVGMVVLCGSSLLGMMWATAALWAAVLIFPRSRMAELLRSHRFGGLIAGGLILLLGVYYLWTLSVGARAGRAATTDWKSPFFIGYELLGFSGLGPGRLELREGGVNAFRQYWIGLASYGVTILVLSGVAVRQLLEGGNRKVFLKLVLIVAAPAIVLMAAGFAMHFRVLGRHFAPLVPAVLFFLSVGVASLWSRRSWLAKLMVCGFFAMSLFSCLSLRFAARHEKDNYREAAAIARAALHSGKRVWWNADPQGAAYYRVPTTEQPAEINKAWWLVNPSRELLSTAPVPEVIIASKPDLFDNQNALAEYIARTGFSKVATLAAFTIWRQSAH